MNPTLDLAALEAQFKKGYKTTEFWVGLVPLTIPAIAWAAKLFGYDVDGEALIASLGAVIPAFGYILSRGWVKKARNEAVAAVTTATPPTP